MVVNPARSLLAGVLFISAIAEAQIGSATWATTVPKNFAEPAWWDQGVVFVGNWEPLIFRRRQGRELPVNYEELYEREHTEETVLKLKQAGVNLIITHFYKAGLEAEREDVEYTKRLAELCHKHGMKIGTYIGGTIFAETLLRDVPEAREWIRRDEHGEPIRYGDQTYRYRPDFNHPGYVEFMKRVIRVAIEDVKTDLIHFDNHALIAPPWTGDTPEINRRFREFFKRKYTPQQLKDRLGFSDISAVTVPTWQGVSQPSAMSPINDPLIQEWIDFRCQDFAEYYGKLAEYIRQLNPNVVVELNPHGIYGTNRAFLNGIDHARLLPHGSVFCSEEPNEAHVDAQGDLVSKIRSLKLARSLEQTLFIYTGAQRADKPTRSYRLLMAEAMAFNRNCFGDIGSPLVAYDLPEDALHYIRFYHQQDGHLAATHDVADVAVLRSFPSMAYNSLGPQLETTLVEQTLIQYKVPFTYVFDQGLRDLSRFKAVVLTNQESLSDKAVELLTAYVRNGGAVLATGRTSLYNDWRRRRPDFGLADVLDVHYREGRLPENHRNKFGRGHAVYLPAIVSADQIAGLETPADAVASPLGMTGFGSKYWKPAKNAAEIVDALRWLTGSPFSVEFNNAPLTTVMNFTERNDGRERVVHWLNYALGSPVDAAELTVATGPGRRVRSVQLLSPDTQGEKTIEFHQQGDRVAFRLPSLEVYEMAVLRFAE
jgi:hypothetical protein